MKPCSPALCLPSHVWYLVWDFIELPAVLLNFPLVCPLFRKTLSNVAFCHGRWYTTVRTLCLTSPVVAHWEQILSSRLFLSPREMLSTLVWMEANRAYRVVQWTSFNPPVDVSLLSASAYVTRHWVNENEYTLTDDELRGRYQSFREETCGDHLVPNPWEGAYTNALTLDTSSVVHDSFVQSLRQIDAFARTFTYLTRAQEYTWQCDESNGRYQTLERKKTRFVTLIGPTGRAVAFRYYEMYHDGPFPKFYCRLDGMFGLQFVDDFDAMLDIVKVGYGRVEVDIAPQINTISLYHIADYLFHDWFASQVSVGVGTKRPGPQDEPTLAHTTTPLVWILWNRLMEHIPLYVLEVHASHFLSQYGTTFKDQVHRSIVTSRLRSYDASEFIMSN